MNLAKLESLGAFRGAEKFADEEFDWTPEGSDTPVKFKIKVKLEPSAADFEFVRFSGIGNEDSSGFARQVHRLVRIVSVDGVEVDDDGRLTDEQAQRLTPSLLMAFTEAMSRVAKSSEKKTSGDKPKKPSRRPTNSGANSSLTE